MIKMVVMNHPYPVSTELKPRPMLQYGGPMQRCAAGHG